MSDDIEAVRNAASAIVDSEVGTENEPSVYILVPFNDPGATSGGGGFPVRRHVTVFDPFDDPRVRTGDQDHGPRGLQTHLRHLDGVRGRRRPGAEPLGATGTARPRGRRGVAVTFDPCRPQLALSNAPSRSEMFLFTDAAAKDGDLKNTVTALIERTQTVVSAWTAVAIAAVPTAGHRPPSSRLGELHDFRVVGGQPQETARSAGAGQDLGLGRAAVQGPGAGVGGAGHPGGHRRPGDRHRRHHAAVVQRVSGSDAAVGGVKGAGRPLTSDLWVSR